MKGRIKTAAAFSVLVLILIFVAVMTFLDRTNDVYPGSDTRIRLYGEAHGEKIYYDIEFDLWKGYYDEGYRALFVELPYYSAEYLNLWMKESSDEIIDRFFEDIKGTQSGNERYYGFLQDIKAQCPGTVFYGTDVGHQNGTTGKRYLEYLEENGLEGSLNYQLAQECIRQGEEFRSDDLSYNGMSSVREAYMVSNFIDAYSRCGEENVMGIYGSYHTDLSDPDLMAGRLRDHYGDIISSVKTSSIAFGRKEPYRIGFCISGSVFLLMLFIPNIYWAKKARPEGYEEEAEKENRVLLILERIGEALVSCALLVFPSADPHVKRLPEGIFFEWTMIFWVTAFVLMVLYECYWIRYFRSGRTLKDQYSSFAGFPLAGATLPVLAALFLGLYSGNLVLIASAVILGIGHVGIHLMHSREAG